MSKKEVADTSRTTEFFDRKSLNTRHFIEKILLFFLTLTLIVNSKSAFALTERQKDTIRGLTFYLVADEYHCGLKIDHEHRGAAIFLTAKALKITPNDIIDHIRNNSLLDYGRRVHRSGDNVGCKTAQDTHSGVTHAMKFKPHLFRELDK